MKTKVDLSKYESMYDNFDKGHQRDHMEGVRKFAVKLAEKYCPDKVEVVYVSATLHDVGLSVSRDKHEIDGYEMIKNDKDIKNTYSTEDFNLILEGIKEHRASTGNPKSIVAKIIKDSDKAYADMYTNFKRAYEYNREKDKKAKHNEILRRAASYIRHTFEEGGYATHTYFGESRRNITGCYKPVINALDNKDFDKLEEILNHQN
jgi:HD superfamily phosphodiesterase